MSTFFSPPSTYASKIVAGGKRSARGVWKFLFSLLPLPVCPFFPPIRVCGRIPFLCVACETRFGIRRPYCRGKKKLLAGISNILSETTCLLGLGGILFLGRIPYRVAASSSLEERRRRGNNGPQVFCLLNGIDFWGPPFFPIALGQLVRVTFPPPLGQSTGEKTMPLI